MKYDSAIGLHNWIYFYHKENRTGRVHDLDYKGYMNTLTLGDVKNTEAYGTYPILFT